MSILSADGARKLVRMYQIQKEWDDYAWNRLFTTIKGAATQGKTSVSFVENETSYFHEDRKEIKKRLENLGYSVKYQRVKICENENYPVNNRYFNAYIISWR